MFYRLIILCFFLPGQLFGQFFFRMEGEFSIKQKNGYFQNLTIGHFYYDRNTRKLVYKVRFPEPEVYVAFDTVMYRFKEGALQSKERIPEIVPFSLFHLVLSQELPSYGLETSLYRPEKTEKEKDLILTTWIPPESLQDKYGKIITALRNNILYGTIFYTPGGELASRQFFEDYVNVSGLIVPSRIIRITPKGKTEIYEEIKLRNIQLNNVAENFYYDFPLPAL